MIVRELPHLAAAINEESWQWLQENTPLLADALEREIEGGATAEEIRQVAMRMTQRPALVMRLRQAASYLMAARNG